MGVGEGLVVDVGKGFIDGCGCKGEGFNVGCDGGRMKWWVLLKA